MPDLECGSKSEAKVRLAACQAAGYTSNELGITDREERVVTVNCKISPKDGRFKKQKQYVDAIKRICQHLENIIGDKKTVGLAGYPAVENKAPMIVFTVGGEGIQQPINLGIIQNELKTLGLPCHPPKDHNGKVLLAVDLNNTFLKAAEHCLPSKMPPNFEATSAIRL